MSSGVNAEKGFAMSEGPKFSAQSATVSTSSETVPGKASLGARLLLCLGWQGEREDDSGIH